MNERLLKSSAGRLPIGRRLPTCPTKAWAAALVLIAGVAGHAELARWVQNIPTPSRLEAVFFRAVAVPVGAIEVLRPPKETRAELGKLIAASPADKDLYALRAHEDELQLDFTSAESDWKKAGALTDLAH